MLASPPANSNHARGSARISLCTAPPRATLTSTSRRVAVVQRRKALAERHHCLAPPHASCEAFAGAQRRDDEDERDNNTHHRERAPRRALARRHRVALRGSSVRMRDARGTSFGDVARGFSISLKDEFFTRLMAPNRTNIHARLRARACIERAAATSRGKRAEIRREIGTKNRFIWSRRRSYNPPVR